MPVTPGVPPPWARKPGATTDFATLVQQQYGDGVDLHTIHLWRRRLIKHWDSVRPPYYGSVSRRSAQVGLPHAVLQPAGT